VTVMARMSAILIFLGIMPVLALVPQFRPISRNLSPAEPPVAPPPQTSSPGREDEESPGGPSVEPDRASRPPERGSADVGVPGRQPADGDDKLPVRRFPPAELLLEGDRFEQLQARLQAQGVDYYVLERQEGPKPGYRFHCRIRVHGSSTYVRPFDAQDEDPLVAMELVLRELEQWNARREARSQLR